MKTQQQYQSLINAPLKKMIFKYLKDDELFPSHFAIDPSQGLISIPIFTINCEQAAYVTESIISSNK